LDVRFSPGKVFGVVLASITLFSIAVLSHGWMPQPGSLHSSVFDAQFHWILVVTVTTFAVAQFVLAAFVWAFRAQAADRIVTFGNREIAAIVIAVVFIGIELFGAATLGRRAWASMYSVSPVDDVMRVQAMSQQFAFYFRYPGTDGQFGPIHVSKIDPSSGNYFGLDRAHDAASRDDVVAASLALPVNRPVELLLDSQDVIHSFYVRELRVQQDMVPGMHIPLRFTPTKTGTYEIVCTQLCGLGHYRMRAYLQVMTEEDFEEWMKAHSRP
jgi:cytochrome c oxidase subunit 2